MIGAVIVFYNPDFTITSKAIEALSTQVDEICIVDNSPINNFSHIERFKKVHYIALMDNVGIATAQNKGIDYLKTKNYRYVLFSDQDSIVEDDLVRKLFQNLESLKNAGIQIATVGTRAINRSTGLPYKAKSKEFAQIKKGVYGNESLLTECYSVRSSVSLTPMTSLSTNGGFDESLFIDGVDDEWCWRAWHKCGLRTFIVEDAKISHMLGTGDRYIGWKRISVNSSFRLYYQYRNFIWLSKRDYIPKFWKRKNFIKYIIKFFYYPIMVKPRRKNFISILLGIKDGLLKSNNWRSLTYNVDKKVNHE